MASRVLPPVGMMTYGVCCSCLAGSVSNHAVASSGYGARRQDLSGQNARLDEATYKTKQNQFLMPQV